MKKNLNILYLLVFLISLGFNAYAQPELPTACGGSIERYRVVGDNGNSDFNWVVTGGSVITKYDRGDSVDIQWTSVTAIRTITVTETNSYGCEGEPWSQNLMVTSPFVDLSPDYAEICQGESSEFVAFASDISSYLWEDGSTGETFIATESGDYWVRVEDTIGCVNSDTATLIVHELPTVDLGPDTMLCDEVNGIVFDVYQDGASYEWSDENEFSSTYTVYPQTRDQEIWVNVTSDFGCVGSDTVVVRFCGDFEIPNAFTPNGDGANDTWVIEELFVFDKVTIDVYNRWGDRVYHSDGYSSGQYWNGLDRKGKKLPMDAYYYVIDLHNDEEPIVGTVTIIR